MYEEVCEPLGIKYFSSRESVHNQSYGAPDFRLFSSAIKEKGEIKKVETPLNKNT